MKPKTIIRQDPFYCRHLFLIEAGFDTAKLILSYRKKFNDILLQKKTHKKSELGLYGVKYVLGQLNVEKYIKVSKTNGMVYNKAYAINWEKIVSDFLEVLERKKEEVLAYASYFKEPDYKQIFSLLNSEFKDRIKKNQIIKDFFKYVFMELHRVKIRTPKETTLEYLYNGLIRSLGYKQPNPIKSFAHLQYKFFEYQKTVKKDLDKHFEKLAREKLGITEKIKKRKTHFRKKDFVDIDTLVLLCKASLSEFPLDYAVEFVLTTGGALVDGRKDLFMLDERKLFKKNDKIKYKKNLNHN